MPEMSGDQTARFIKQLNQDIPVIMLTGFGALIEVTGSQPQAVDVVLNKPVTIDALRRTIDKLAPCGLNDLSLAGIVLALALESRADFSRSS